MNPIPGPVITVVSQILGSFIYSHNNINLLFAEKGAPGDPPEGNCPQKIRAWFIRAGRDEHCDAMRLLGEVLQDFMEVDQKFHPRHDQQTEGRRSIAEVLQRNGLTYQPGGRVVGANTALPTRELQLALRSRDMNQLDVEFRRAIENVDHDPPATLTAACSLLEALFRVYIEDEQLTLPPEKSLMPLWKVVRDHLGFDPKSLEDDDLKKILQGLASIVDGIACARTHMGSAHGRGRRPYAVKPRHARLAAHAAHTLALFVLETWDDRKRVQG